MVVGRRYESHVVTGQDWQPLELSSAEILSAVAASGAKPKTQEPLPVIVTPVAPAVRNETSASAISGWSFTAGAWRSFETAAAICARSPAFRAEAIAFVGDGASFSRTPHAA